MESSVIIIQGFLRKHTGGIFFGTKKRWAALTSDGVLSLSKRSSQIPYNRIKLLEFSDFNYEDDNQSFTFCSVEDGVLVRAIKFYTLEPPTFDEWVKCIQRVRNTSNRNLSPAPQRHIKFLKEKSISMKALFHASEETRDSILTSDLTQIDPVLKVQSGGESVAKSGFVRKRGGGKGGNRAFKKRWFVVTHFGRVLYFKTATSSAPLGQFSLIDAKFDSAKENEVSIKTESRLWELLFESEREKMEWMVVLNRITLDLESEGPIRSAGLSKKINIGDVGLHPRNVSLIQKSTIALGFQAERDADEELNRINGITRRISGRNHSDTMGKWDELTVACVTWNLSESLPKMSDIRFLRRLRSCHIVTVGVQECQSVIYHSFQSDQLSPVDVWLVMVKSAMGEGFTLVASRAMGAIHVCVFVRHDILDCVSNVSTTYVPCGIGNVMYNKGAVGVRLNVYDTSVAFICAHLAANKEKIIDRCQDFHRIAHVIIENLGKSATLAKMAKECQMDDHVRESETLELDFCSTRYQQRRSTFVEVKSNPLVELGHDADIPAPEIRMKNGLLKDIREEDRRPHSTGYVVDTRDRLSREFDRCFFFGDLNYRLESEKLWTQTLLSMSDKMLSLQEEEENLLKMQHSVDLSDNPSPGDISEEQPEDISDELPLPPSPSLHLQQSRDSEISRKSHEAAKKLDKFVESCNSASFRISGKPRYPSDRRLPSFPSSPRVPTPVIEPDSLHEVQAEEDATLQMLVNLVPTGEYESEEEDEDGDAYPVEEIDTNSEVDNLFKALEEASHGVEITDERFSLFISTMDQDYSSSMDDTACDASVDGNPRTSTVQRLSESAPYSRLPQENKKLIFGSIYRKPRPLLSPSARSGVEFFMIQTGFRTPDDIFDRLMHFDQLMMERKKGTVLMGFEEGKICFKPSYKFDPFTEIYDTGKKSRTPAWCDRIFYNTPRYGKEIELQTYECIHGEFHSDHRAVVGIYKIKV